ncbi:cellulase-domain-containing protein [Anaeromyces robustus]|uniref:Cellulase-domain-containing protein n=1 Tax=Anaeromyces robustus TaxID=1754192 RepID=A0A1Y1VTD9_9FUNG|nr:cellulase-domain-containing protein [Anaeromyces robustus]|eukprot:ORX64572.1 cellulase-domain-containing protein [Anaeromyces robustus]
MKIIDFLLLFSLAIYCSKAIKNISSKELVKDLKIGWNLGNALDAQCIDTIDYSKDQLASETCWGNPKATSSLYKKLNELGFNTFRIPVTWSGHFGEGPDYKIDTTWMNRVHEVVDYALNTGSYVILNVHHETWNHAFTNNLNQAKIILVALWKQIALEFAKYDEHLIFEGLNEPRKVNTAMEWNGGDKEGWDFVNEMNKLFVKTIRTSGGNNIFRHLMIPTYAASVNDGAINHFKLPSKDNKLIVSLHSYSPYNFALNNGDGATTTFTETNEIDNIMNLIKTKFIQKNIPVIIGEFGATNRNNEMERVKWAKYYIKKAKAIGVPCILWDNGIFEGEGERFGIIDRSSLKIVYPDLLDGLMSNLKNTKNNNNKNKKITKTITTTKVTKTKNSDNGKITTTKTITSTIVTTINPTTKVNNNNKKIIKVVKSKKTSKITKTKTYIRTRSKTTGKNIPIQTVINDNYNSCRSRDIECKKQMYDLCYKGVSRCYSSGKDPKDCKKMDSECSKIME